MKHARILPSRPLRLQAGLLGRARGLCVLLAVLGSGALATATVWQASTSSGLRHEKAVFAGGVPAVHSSLTGYRADITSAYISRTTVPSGDPGGFSLWRSYVLTVEYTDNRGANHKHDIELMCMFGAVDERSPVLVRYDPQNADDFALSWAVDMARNRAMSTGLEAVTLGLTGVALLVVAYFIRRNGYDALHVSEDGEEVQLEVVSSKELMYKGEPTGFVEYRYRVAGEAKSRIRKESLNKKNEPVFLDAGKHLMLGLWSPRNGRRIMVLSGDLSPFAFAADEREAIHQRIVERRAVSTSA